jgi:predicted kinase
LRHRIVARRSDASEATVAVLEKQLAWFESLDDDERTCTVNPG